MTYNENMTFTVTAYGKTVTITMPDDIDMHEFLATCRDLAIATRYHEDSWKDAVIEMANEYLEEEEQAVNARMDEVLAQYPKGSTYVVEDKAKKVYTGKSTLTSHWEPLYDSNC
jgi:hypothetical protein